MPGLTTVCVSFYDHFFFLPIIVACFSLLNFRCEGHWCSSNLLIRFLILCHEKAFNYIVKCVIWPWWLKYWKNCVPHKIVSHLVQECAKAKTQKCVQWFERHVAVRFVTYSRIFLLWKCGSKQCYPLSQLSFRGISISGKCVTVSEISFCQSSTKLEYHSQWHGRKCFVSMEQFARWGKICS